MCFCVYAFCICWKLLGSGSLLKVTDGESVGEKFWQGQDLLGLVRYLGLPFNNKTFTCLKSKLICSGSCST